MAQNFAKRQAIINWILATPFFAELGIRSLEQLAKPAQMAKVLSLFHSIFENETTVNFSILSQYCQQMGVTLDRQVQGLLRGRKQSESSKLRLGQLLLQLSVMSLVREQSIRGLLTLKQKDKLILKAIISPEPQYNYQEQQEEQLQEINQALTQENCQLRGQVAALQHQALRKDELVCSLQAELNHFKTVVGSLNEQLEHQEQASHLNSQQITKLVQQLSCLKQAMAKQRQEKAALQRANQELLMKLQANQSKEELTKIQKRTLTVAMLNQQSSSLSKGLSSLLQSQTLALIDYHQRFRDKVGTLLARRIM